MKTRGSVSELPKVQAAVVSSRAPTAHSHRYYKMQRLSSCSKDGSQPSGHEAAAPGIFWPLWSAPGLLQRTVITTIRCNDSHLAAKLVAS